MQGNTYYIILAVFVVMTLFSLKHDKWMFAFIFILLGGWVYYTHETGVTYADLKEDLGKAVDESAQTEYNKKIQNDYHEDTPVETSRPKSSSSKKFYETDPRYKVGE